MQVERLAPGVGVAQIVHAVSLDARTVRRWLDEPRFRPRITPARASKLDPFKGYIRRLLEHHPFSASQILNRLREAGYDGGATIVKDYLQRVRPMRAPAFLTLHFAPGEAAQIDWGHYGSVNVGNTRRRLSFFVMVLCYSRLLYVELTVSQTMEHFLGCHLIRPRTSGGSSRAHALDAAAQARLPHRHRTLWRVWRYAARHRVHRNARTHRENPHPSRRPQHRVHRPPPRTAAPSASHPTPGRPLSGPVLTVPAGGTGGVSVLEELEEVSAMAGVERGESEVEDDEVD